MTTPSAGKGFVAGILALFRLEDVAPAMTLAAASGSKEATKATLLAER